MGFDKLSRKDTAKAFFVNPRTVTRWHQDGMPRNDDGTYNLPECIAWRLDRLTEDMPAGDETEESAKWLAEFRKERATLARMKREHLEGRLVDIDEVQQDAFNKGRQIRDTLLNLPARLSAILAAESDGAKIDEILTKEIKQALEVLSK